MIFLEATHTHLYPGHRGKLRGLVRIVDLGEESDCLVEFSDGSATHATLSGGKKGWKLCTDGYQTSAGSTIVETCWIVSLAENNGAVIFRVVKRSDEFDSRSG